MFRTESKALCFFFVNNIIPFLESFQAQYPLSPLPPPLFQYWKSIHGKEGDWGGGGGVITAEQD